MRKVEFGWLGEMSQNEQQSTKEDINWHFFIKPYYKRKVKAKE